jgi:hypothetical protein
MSVYFIFAISVTDKETTSPSAYQVNRPAQAMDPAVTEKYVKPSADGAIGNVPAPQVAVAGPPFTLTLRPSKFEHPQPFTRALVRRQIAPVVLKLPDWFVKLTGFEHVPLPPLNVAVTDLVAVSETVQGPVPVHAPLQPVNVEPPVGVAVRVTEVPLR